MKSVQVGKLEIAYRRAGAGPPLLLLHGAATDGRSWRPQLEGLAGWFDVIAWDEPGAGGSSDPRDDLDLPGYAATLVSFAEALGLARFHVAGLSWGGVMAQEVALLRPDLVGGLVLADTYAGWKGSLEPAECRSRLEFALAQSEAPPGQDAPLLPGLFRPDAPAELIEDAAALTAEARPTSLRRNARLLAASDLRERQREIQVPCLLIWGELDARSPLSIAESLLERIAGARLAVIPGAGHMSNLERPEAFNDELRRFCLEIPL